MGLGGQTGGSGGDIPGRGGSAGGGTAGVTASGGATTSGGATGSGGATAGAGGKASGGAGGSDSAGSHGGTSGNAGAGGVGGGSSSGAWSMGYYVTWQVSQLPVAEIEWSGLTHIALAFYTPKGNSLSLSSGSLTLPDDLVRAAHAHGVKAIASIGGADSSSDLRAATTSGAIDQFVANLVDIMSSPGYDGIDIDWEPLDKSDQAAVVDLAKRVRKAKPGAVLTIPVAALNVNLGVDLSSYAAIADVYDQVNVMSYGMSGTYSGWKSWHSSPLFHTDSATPTSIDSTVKLYLAAGVPAKKLGIGIGFYGLCYSTPVTAPDQALNGATLLASDGAISYASIMTNYYSATARKWDSLARVPYLSFSAPHAPDDCTYISYDDEQSIAEKGAYLKSMGLGGVIQWELNEAHLPAAPVGQRDPLMNAIHDNVLN